jgi:hypothetical protein
MAHLHPTDAVMAADGVHHRVEALAHHPIQPLHPSREQDLDELVGGGPLGHDDPHGRARSGQETTLAWLGGTSTAAVARAALLPAISHLAPRSSRRSSHAAADARLSIDIKTAVEMG